MLTTTDRGGQTFALCPTAEEVVTDYAKTGRIPERVTVAAIFAAPNSAMKSARALA